MIIVYYTDATGKVTGATAMPDAPQDYVERFKKVVGGMDALLGWGDCNAHVIEAENDGLLAYLAQNGAANYMTDAVVFPVDSPGT